VGESHAVAAGMGGGDQLFRIGALGILEAGGVGERRVVQYAAGSRHLAAAIAQVAPPVAGRLTIDSCHYRCLLADIADAGCGSRWRYGDESRGLRQVSGRRLRVPGRTLSLWV